MEPIHSFDDLQLDVLKEVGNIGAGHAATALSKLLNKPIDMQVPKVSMLPFDAITEIVGGPEQIVVAVFLRIYGDAPGNMFFIIHPHIARRLLFSLAGLQAESENEFTEMEQSALSEIANILAGSYLSSLADFMKLNMLPSVPAMATDMAGAILGYGFIQYGKMGDQALLIETNFLEGQEEVQGHFFLIPDPDSLPKIFTALGVSSE